MSVWISLFFIALGLFLILSPNTWHRLNAPAAEKHVKPDAKTLRRIRRRGIPFLAGGILLLVLHGIRIVQ